MPQSGAQTDETAAQINANLRDRTSVSVLRPYESGTDARDATVSALVSALAQNEVPVLILNGHGLVDERTGEHQIKLSNQYVPTADFIDSLLSEYSMQHLILFPGQALRVSALLAVMLPHIDALGTLPAAFDINRDRTVDPEELARVLVRHGVTEPGQVDSLAELQEATQRTLIAITPSTGNARS